MLNNTVAPDWDWTVVAYLFTGGMAAGLFVLGGVLRFFGRAEDRVAARFAFLAALPLLVACPVLLISHLGVPARFWHMLINMSEGGLTLKPASPISAGVWGLTLFGGVAGLVFLNELVRGPQVVSATPGSDRLITSRRRSLLPEGLEKGLLIAGMVLAVFVMGYTGVLLSVSSQPVWSDTWAMGGLFSASALATGTAAFSLLLLLARRQQATGSGLLERMGEILFYLVVLELILLAIFTLSLGNAASRLSGGTHGTVHTVALVVELAAAVLLAPLGLHLSTRALTPARRNLLLGIAGILVLTGGLMLRFSMVYVNQV